MKIKNLRGNVWIWPFMFYAFLFRRTYRGSADVILGAAIAFVCAAITLYFLYAYVRVPDTLRLKKGLPDMRKWPRDIFKSFWKFTALFGIFSLLLSVAAILKWGWRW